MHPQDLEKEEKFANDLIAKLVKLQHIFPSSKLRNDFFQVVCES